MLGKGDARLAVSATPLLLLGQMIALPLWLFLGSELAGIARGGKFLEAFLGLIALPLALVALTEGLARCFRPVQKWLGFTAWLPVPLLARISHTHSSRDAARTRPRKARAGFPAGLYENILSKGNPVRNVAGVGRSKSQQKGYEKCGLALTVFLIAGAQSPALGGSLPLLGATAAVFTAYAVAVPFLARFTARLFGLSTGSQRTAIFSAGTRNSFVVLPLALALPAGWEIAAAVIVLQSLVELFAMAGYLWWVPTRLVPDRNLQAADGTGVFP